MRIPSCRAVLSTLALIATTAIAHAETKPFPFFPTLTDEQLNQLLHEQMKDVKALPRKPYSAKATVPVLTQLFVSTISSTDCNCTEAIGRSKNSTTNNHGGTITIVTFEQGSGNNPKATMSGSTLPSTENYDKNNLCGTGASIHVCKTEESVTGVAKYWKMTGYYSGRFTYQNTSTSNSTITKSTYLDIK